MHKYVSLKKVCYIPFACEFVVLRSKFAMCRTVLQSALGKAGNLDTMFELFEKSRGDDKWPYMNQRQRVEHLNIRCINVVLGCIRHNQLGYNSVLRLTD